MEQVVCEPDLSLAGDVFYPGSEEYTEDMSHYGTSNMQQALLSIRPNTARDVGTILKYIAFTRTPFAVKGGGHAMNPGFSSSRGIHISMVKFSEVTYDNASQTAVIGAGLIWDEVYEKLAEDGVSVIGARVSGIGVAGFILGGGYSWKSNQHGLTLDSVVAFELVKPNGSIVNVSATSDPDLFFGLRGGLNNFGIVTRFTLKTYTQEQVWGGINMYSTEQGIRDIIAAIVKFTADVTDPKACILVSYSVIGENKPSVILTLFYDAPTQPEGIFDKILAVKSTGTSDDGKEFEEPFKMVEIKTREFLDFIKAIPGNFYQEDSKGIFHTVPLVSHTQDIMDEILREIALRGEQFKGKTSLIAYTAEPFLHSVLSHSSTPSAYPPDRLIGFSPFHIYYCWKDSEVNDTDIYQAVHQSAIHIHNAAVTQGQPITAAALYPNYAIFDTPLERMYGENVPVLRALKAAVDPDGVMNLAGGFKF